MFIECLAIGPYQTNCYIFGSKQTKEVVVIDAGEDIERLIDHIREKEYKVQKILITHGHFDHTNGIAKLKSFTGAKAYMNEKDLNFLKDQSCIDVYLKEGDRISIGNAAITVIETPGHTRGGLCYKHDNILFSGDTLFYKSIGRTDLPGGNYNQLINSIEEKLLTLTDDVKVYPGHGPSTTIHTERTANPYLT